MTEPELEERSASPWQRLRRYLRPSPQMALREMPRLLRSTTDGVVRLTAAAVLSYLLALALTDGPVDLTGPLTALLVVQASAFSTIKMGLVRVGAVLSGVLIATALSAGIGLTWWSLGAAIAAALIVAKLLRLGEQALEAPISAMLILGVTNHDVAAEVRVLNTLIGAGVGVAFNLVYPPGMPTRAAVQSLVRAADAAAAALDLAADELVQGTPTRRQVDGWLDRARAASRSVATAGETIAALEDSRRLNPRALGTKDTAPVLATGLTTVEQCLWAVRALFVVMRSEMPPEEVADDPYGEELRHAFAVVLHDAGDCLRAFGSLVVAEADDREEETETALAESLEILRETRAILAELITVDPRDHPASWLLRGSILAAVEQVLVRLDIEERARMRRIWEEEQLRRPLAQLPPLIREMWIHPEHPYPRGVHDAMDRRRPQRPDDD